MTAPNSLARLRDAGYRLTASRRAVLNAIGGLGPHFTAEEVLGLGREQHPNLGRATVYRTLEVASELGLIRPVAGGEGIEYFVVSTGGHHHLVCCRCGDKVEFDDCALGELGPRVARRYRFELQGHLRELYGICADCRMPQAEAAARAPETG